jgi:hypothetical protein
MLWRRIPDVHGPLQSILNRPGLSAGIGYKSHSRIAKTPPERVPGYRDVGWSVRLSRCPQKAFMASVAWSSHSDGPPL